MLRLYFGQNSAALAPHIVLEEIGAPYEVVKVDFAANAQRSPEYLAINPKGRVPALATDRGILTENVAILTYLAQTFPERGLAPADPFELARLQAFNSYLASTVHVAHAHRMRGTRWADDPAAIAEMKRKVPESVGAAFALIEDEFLQGPWVMGDTFTIADPYLFTLAQWLEIDRVDLGRLPRVLDHRARVAERTATKAALAQEFA